MHCVVANSSISTNIYMRAHIHNYIYINIHIYAYVLCLSYSNHESSLKMMNSVKSPRRRTDSPPMLPEGGATRLNIFGLCAFGSVPCIAQILSLQHHNFFFFSPDFFDFLAPRILARFIATYFTLLHEFAPHGEWKITSEIERFVLKWVFADHSPVQPEARHLGLHMLAKIHLRICARTPGLKCCYKLRAFVYLHDLVSFKESIQKLLTNDFHSINFQIQSQSH